MNRIRTAFIATIVAAGAFVPAASAYGPAPETRVSQLDALVHLDPSQRAQALTVFQRDAAEVDALSPQERPRKLFDIRANSRARIQALLTPDQLHVYNRAPQAQGGGRNIPPPEARVEQLDQQVGHTLTAEQKQAALQIYAKEFEVLVDLPQEQRFLTSAALRRETQDSIHELLTSMQVAKQQTFRSAEEATMIEEHAAMEKALRESAEVNARVGSIVRLSSDLASTGITAESRKGWARYSVVGDRATAPYRVDWERVPANAPVKVVRVAPASAE